MLSLVLCLLIGSDRPEIELPSFRVTEVRHSKQVTELKMYHEGKEIQVGQKITCKDKDTSIVFKYKVNGVIVSQKIDIDLYDGPFVTEYDFELLDVEEKKTIY